MPVAARQRARGATIESGRIPAPVGGMNTVDAGSAMPPQDAVWIYNMLAAEYGLRTRLGYKEWATGVTGGLYDDVRTMLSFAGSAKNGAQNKLFACTAEGIYDVTASTTTPSLVATFQSTGADAGFGSSTTFSTPAGRFLVYCDEENGLWIWSESASAWSQVGEGTTQQWTAQTSYFAGNEVVNGPNAYVCTVDGVSAASGGPTGTGTGITDGTATWDFVSVKGVDIIGTGIDAQNDGLQVDPADFAHVCVFKNRLWFVERDTTRAWYLDVNALYGTATAFDFGAKLRAGGPLRGLWNWSYDGGAGIDTLLVGVSGAGDVIIYQGTDPDNASTFGLKGCWSVGAVPAGRRIATDYGGDLLLMSLVGIVPLSRLVVGTDEATQGAYSTYKVGNLFNQLSTAARDLPGWAIFIHPQDNALMALVPTTPGKPTEQLVMAFGTKGWSRYRDLPIFSAVVHEGDVYFGTYDGRVCRNEGFVDNVLLSDPDSYDPVKWSVLTAYRNLGSERQKQVKMLRPVLLGNTTHPVYEARALYDWDLNEPTSPTGISAGGWDGETWDVGVWGGDLVPSAQVTGAVGMGRDVAIAIRGEATGRTVLVDVGVTFEQGGLL